MSKGLEALNDLKTFSDCLATNKRFPKVFKESDCYGAIEKELKALEIIKKYIRVNKPFGSACYIYLNDESEMIPQEEFDLLKEVLL